MVLEKAWAKIHGTYQRIDGGQAYTTLRDLTGAPSFEYIIEEEKDKGLWEKIINYDQANFIMCAGIDGGNEEKDTELGLVAGHAYGLIAAKTITDNNGKSVNIVKLRNPWG